MENKVAIVTGAGSSGPGWGIGKAISVLFARQGMRVLLVDRERERAEEALQTIRDEGGAAEICVGDVTLSADVASITDYCLDHFGTIDVLCNNVGIVGQPGLQALTEEQWDEVFAVNVKSAFLMCRSAVPAMLQAGAGRIVNIASISGLCVSTKPAYAYAASKAALIQFTKALAAEYAAHGIRSNCIIPGTIDTPMAANSLAATGLDKDELAAVMRARDLGSPTGKQGTAWDIANAALFLAGAGADYINGAEIVVDGGLTCLLAKLQGPR